MGTLPLNNPGEFFGSLNCANKALICAVHGVCPYVNRILCQHHKLMFAHTKLVTFSRTIVCYTRQQTLRYDVCDLTGFTFPPPLKKGRKDEMPNILFCALLGTVNKRQKGDGSITGEAHNYFQHRFSLPSEIPSFQTLRYHEFFSPTWQLISFVITSFMWLSTVFMWLGKGRVGGKWGTKLKEGDCGMLFLNT